MLNSVRFYISWIVSAILMYAAFYIWHGVFLNDINSITFPKLIFLGLAAIVYLVIAVILYKIFETNLMSKYFYSPMLRGIMSGIILGFFLFAFVTVLGISFTKNHSLTNILVDCVWQIIEQMLGGAIIGLGKIFIFDPHLEMEKD